MPWGSEEVMAHARMVEDRQRRDAQQLGDIVNTGYGSYKQERDRIARQRQQEAENFFRQEYLGLAKGQDTRGAEMQQWLRDYQMSQQGIAPGAGADPRLGQVAEQATLEDARRRNAEKLKVALERRDRGMAEEKHGLAMQSGRLGLAEAQKTPEQQAAEIFARSKAGAQGAAEGQRAGQAPEERAARSLAWLQQMTGGGQQDPVQARQLAEEERRVKAIVASGKMSEVDARAFVAGLPPDEGGDPDLRREALAIYRTIESTRIRTDPNEKVNFEEEAKKLQDIENFLKKLKQGGGGGDEIPGWKLKMMQELFPRPGGQAQGGTGAATMEETQGVIDTSNERLAEMGEAGQIPGTRAKDVTPPAAVPANWSILQQAPGPDGAKALPREALLSLAADYRQNPTPEKREALVKWGLLR